MYSGTEVTPNNRYTVLKKDIFCPKTGKIIFSNRCGTNHFGKSLDSALQGHFFSNRTVNLWKSLPEKSLYFNIQCPKIILPVLEQKLIYFAHCITPYFNKQVHILNIQVRISGYLLLGVTSVRPY